MKYFNVFAIIFLFTACSKYTVEPKKEFTKPNDFKEKILFVADNQKALTLTLPISEQSEFSEKSVGTAHRRAALDEFSLDILKYINKKSSAELIIHAGDILNNSCESEYCQVVNTLDSFKKPWYIAPGNHDGYYLGISSPMNWKSDFTSIYVLNERNGWNEVCKDRSLRHLEDINISNENDICKNTERRENKSEHTQTIVDKYSFVQKYITTMDLTSNNINEFKIPLSDIEIVCQFSKNDTSIDRKSKKNGFLHSLCWTQKIGKNLNYNYYDSENNIFLENKPWRHFIVQLLKVPDGNTSKNILIVDSANYKEGISIDEKGIFDITGFGAADNAYITEEQRMAIDKIIENNNIDFVVGHHPLEDYKSKWYYEYKKKNLVNKSYEYITNLIENTTMGLYISGDTHDGYDVIYTNKENNKSFREANLGSTIDAPLEYANLSFETSFLDRKSLTPLSINGKKKKSKYKKLKKDYASMDTKWEECIKEFYSKDNKVDLKEIPSNPLSINSNKLLQREFELFRTNNYFSKRAYKVKRFIDLIDLYKKLFYYVGIENRLANNLKYKEIMRKLTMELYNINRKCILNDNMLNSPISYSSDVIKIMRNNLDNLTATESKKLENYKVCSAIFESEREYLESKNKTTDILNN